MCTDAFPLAVQMYTLRHTALSLDALQRVTLNPKQLHRLASVAEMQVLFLD